MSRKVLYGYAVGFVLAAFMATFYFSFCYAGKDFDCYYTMARNFFSGSNPYESASPILPFFFILISPIFAFFDYDTAFWALVSASVLAGLLMPFFIISRLNFNRYLASIVIVFFLLTTKMNIELGQVVMILACAFAVSVWALKQKHEYLTGISATWLLIKPHLFLPYFIYLVYIVLREKRYKILYAGLITVVLVSLITLVTNPHCFIDWMNFFHRYTPMKTVSINELMIDVDMDIDIAHLKVYRMICPLVFILFFISLMWKNKTNDLDYLFLGMPVNAVLLPYGSFFDLVCVTPVLLYVISYSYKIDGRVKYYLWLIAALYFIIIFFAHYRNILYTTCYPVLAMFCLIGAIILIIKHKKVSAKIS